MREGYCRMEINMENKHLNPFGGIHGGVYAAALDSVAYWAVYCSLAEDTGLITLDISANMVSTASCGKLIAEGELIKVGRSVCIANATIKDENGKLLACGTSKMLVTSSMQTINQAIVAQGNDSLPPKFL